MTQDPHPTEQAPGSPLNGSESAETPEVGTERRPGGEFGPQTGAQGFEGEPLAAADDCEHHYETRILGGHPLHVRACTLCRTPDWTDLYQQADTLYQWGREEALAGKPPRERLSAYDMPRQDDRPEQAKPEPSEAEQVRDAVHALQTIVNRVYDAVTADQPRYPYADSDHAVLGPDVTASGDGETILWQGARYRRDRGEEQGHVYLSTGCLHGEHGYCQSNTGLNGAKTPGTCKFCAAACTCVCHREPPAHDAGPSVAECAAVDRNWDVEKAGER